MMTQAEMDARLKANKAASAGTPSQQAITPEMQEARDEIERRRKEAQDEIARRKSEAVNELAGRTAVTDYKGQSIPGKIGTISGDFMGALIHGGTLGFDDKLDRVINNYNPWGTSAEDFDKQRAARNAERTARLEYADPGSSTALDLLGGAALPSGLLARGVGQGAGWARAGARGVANILENAGYGAASAYGHDQDPTTGAAIGAAGGLVSPVVRGVVPQALKAGTDAIGIAAGHMFGGVPGAILGNTIIQPAGSAVRRGASAVMNSDVMRNILARIAAAPGRFSGQIQGGGQ